MSEANKAVLRIANEAIVRGDFEGFLSQCTEDTTWEFIGDRTLRGKDAVRRWMADAYREPPKFQVDRLIAEGDFLVAIGEISLPASDGQPTEHLYCDVWRLENGKLAGLRAFVLAPSDRKP